MGVQFNHETALAFGRLLATLIVSVGATFGWTFDANLVLNIILSVLAVILFVYSCWWKNNNITEAAQESQKVLDQLKLSEKVEETVETQAKEAAKESEEAGNTVNSLD